MLTRNVTSLLGSLLLGVVVGSVMYSSSPALAQDAPEEKAAAEAKAAVEKLAEAVDPADNHAAEAHEKDAHASDAHAPESAAQKFDIGHGNATDMLERPEEFTRFDLSIYTFIVFALLMALLWKFAWGPIAKALDHRESSIAKMLDDAKAASETAARQLQQYEAKLLAAQEEAGKIVGDARKSAEEVAAKIQADAEASAERQRERAVADIEQAKNTALHEIAAKSVDTAVDLAGKIIRREVKAADHQQLIAESLNRFQNN